MAQLVKTVAGLAIASVKTVNGLAIASVKTIAGLDNTSGGGGSTVTIDTVATAVSESPGSGNPTIQITTAVVGSGSNRLLMCFCGAGDSVVGDRTVQSVTSSIDGALTHLAADGDDGNFCRSEIWYLVAPSTGTHTLSVLWTGTAGGGTVDGCAANAISFTGVDQSTPFTSNGGVNGTSASTTPTTGSQTVGTGEMLVGVIETDAEAISVTAGTQRWEVENIGSDTSTGGATRSDTGALTWSQTSNPYGISWAVINAAP